MTDPKTTGGEVSYTEDARDLADALRHPREITDLGLLRAAAKLESMAERIEVLEAARAPVSVAALAVRLGLIVGLGGYAWLALVYHQRPIPAGMLLTLMAASGFWAWRARS